MEMSNELVVRNELDVMDVKALTAQVDLVQEMVKAVMKDGVHYGTIPGCGDRKVLLKPGADKLALAFRLNLQCAIEVVELGEGHREYKAACKAYHIKTGDELGSANGSCTTLEGKYRYRWDNTGKPVPKEYWEVRNADLIGGSSFAPRKVWIEGKQLWYIFQKVAHSDPADYFNTCLKMAEKRAKVACILNVTAASDVLMQDDVDEETGEITPPTEKKKNSKPTVTPPAEKDSEIKEAIFGVKTITQKAGKKTNGTEYTKFTITADDRMVYGTFSSTDADTAKIGKNSNLKIKVKYKENQYGKTIEDKGVDVTDEETIEAFAETGAA